MTYSNFLCTFNHPSYGDTVYTCRKVDLADKSTPDIELFISKVTQIFYDL